MRCLACHFNPDVKCNMCDKSYCHRCFKRDPLTGAMDCDKLGWTVTPRHLYKYINPEWEEIK